MKTLKEYLLVIIDLPESKILGWYDDQISTVFDGKKMLATGALYTCGSSVYCSIIGNYI